MPTTSAPVADPFVPAARAATGDGGATARERERRQLARDLPESGVGAHALSPAVLFLILLIGLAVATAAHLDVAAPAGPSAAVVEAEHRNVDRLAVSLAQGASGTAGPASGPDGPASAPASGPDGPASAPASGPDAPASGPDALAERLPDGGLTVQGGTLWVTDGSRTVPAGAAAPPAGPATAALAPAGPVPAAAPPAPTPPEPAVRLAAEAAAAARGGSGRGELTGPAGPDGRADLAVYAPVRAGHAAVPPRLWLVSTSRVQVEPAVVGGQGWGPALVLAGLAVLGFLLVEGTLVRPQRRLREAALSIAAGDLATPAPRSRVREVAALARGFDYCRLRLGAAPIRRGRRSAGVPAWTGVTLAALAVVAWSVLTVLLVPGRATVPDQLADAASAGAAVTAQRAGHSLNQGLADTAAVVASHPPAPDTAPELTRLLDGGRFRGARLVDGAGGGLRSAGHPLLTGPAPGPDGLAVAAAADVPVPVPTARATAADGFAVVAEFDVQRLAEVIADPPARTRLVDGGMRVVTATDGYLAFEQLADPAARDLVEQARRVGPSARVTGDAVVSAAPVREGPAAALGLTVVEEQPVGSVSSSVNELRRRAALLGLLAAAVAVTMWFGYTAWQVRPLRRAARMADELCRGDVGTVIFGQHLGPGGTTLSCLDICRRAVALGGPARLGARRPAPDGVRDGVAR